MSSKMNVIGSVAMESGMDVIGKIIIGGILGVLAICDIKKKRIPLYGPVVLAMTGLVIHLKGDQMEWKSMLAGIALGGMVILISLLSKGAIGFGDGLILAALGFYLGFWNNLLLFFYSVLCSGLLAVALVLVKKTKLGSELPFVPFLAIAYVLVVVL